MIGVDRVLKIDEPVRAIAVRGANGLWGLLAVGLLADGKYGDGGQLLAQLTSIVTLVVWCSFASSPSSG